jgi:hypothetical protein
VKRAFLLFPDEDVDVVKCLSLESMHKLSHVNSKMEEDWGPGMQDIILYKNTCLQYLKFAISQNREERTFPFLA